MDAPITTPRLSWWCLLAIAPVFGVLVGLGDILWFDSRRGHGTLLVSLASLVVLWGTAVALIIAVGSS